MPPKASHPTTHAPKAGGAVAKKTPKPKLRPAKPSGEPAAAAPTREQLLAAERDGLEHLHGVLEQLFGCYDEDGDGQIERVEFLDVEEKRLGRLGFGPKERREAFAWFKDAGAEGTPLDGMFLSRERFEAAYRRTAAQESGIPEAEAEKLAAWLWEHRAQELLRLCHPGHPEHPEHPEKAATAGAEAGAAAASSAPPSYPLTCGLRQLKEHLEAARRAGRAALVLSSGLTEVETFMNYQVTSLVDCKQLLNEVFVTKSKSREEAQEDLRGKLTSAMNSMGFARPLHIRMANSAFDWNGFCCGSFPPEVFSGTLWTIQHAFDLGFFDESQKFNLEVEDEKRWKEFQVIITSTFDLEKANEYLFDKIPFFDELAIIVIDPTSVTAG